MTEWIQSAVDGLSSHPSSMTLSCQQSNQMHSNPSLDHKICSGAGSRVLGIKRGPILCTIDSFLAAS